MGGEMSKLLSESLADENRAKRRPRQSRLTKKERLKQELLGHVAEGFDSMASGLQKEEDEDSDVKAFKQQADAMMGQMMNRAKFKVDTKVTLREFCDLVWRTGNASPLDEDEDEQPRQNRHRDDDNNDDEL